MKPKRKTNVLFPLVFLFLTLFPNGELDAQDFTFFAEHTIGSGDAVVQIDVVNPAETTGDRYRVFFTQEFGRLSFSVQNLNTQIITVNTRPFDSTSPEFEGIRVTASSSPSQYKDLLEVQYGGMPVNPPAHIFRPGDREGEGGNNSTNEYTFVGVGGDGGFAQIARSENNTGSFDYEIRFDGNPLGINKLVYRFSGQGTIDAPFSVWNVGIGTPDDPSDDYQIIAAAFDDSGNPSMFDGGALPSDGGPGTMYDRIYVYEINQNALPQGDINNDGIIDYSDVLQDINDNGGDISQIFSSRPYVGNEVLARFSMVSLNGDPNYLPPPGTTIRITTTKPPTEQDVYEFTSSEFGLTVSPRSIYFGNVRLNERFTLPLAIINSAGMDITVDNIEVNHPDFLISQSNFTLSSGDSTIIEITFMPTNAGIVSASLTVSSNDPFFPQFQVSLSGEGLPITEGVINILGHFDIRFNNVKREDVSDIWGYFDPNTGKEYALVGYGIFNTPPNAGVSIVDITNPALPMEVANVNSVPGFDVKTWLNYMYSVNGGGSGLGGIVDISDPTNPQLVGSFPSSHNITISDDGYMYLENPRLRIFDLNADPTNPTLIWTGGVEGHDATVIGNRLYDFHGGAGTFIYDVTNPSNPQILGSITDPNIRYHHSGWPMEDGRYLFICDELATHPTPDITVWDIGDPGNPQKVGEFSDPTATIHNLFIIRNIAYTSYYAAGFRIFDISDPTRPTVIDEFDTSPDFSSEDFNGAWGAYPFAPSGNIYISDIQTGLHVFSLRIAGRMTGDLTGDGVVNVQDLIRVIDMILGTGGEPTEPERVAADVNEDGVINVGDLIEIINIILGIGQKIAPAF